MLVSRLFLCYLMRCDGHEKQTATALHSAYKSGLSQCVVDQRATHFTLSHAVLAFALAFVLAFGRQGTPFSNLFLTSPKKKPFFVSNTIFEGIQCRRCIIAALLIWAYHTL